jgi:hypothetical protein
MSWGYDVNVIRFGNLVSVARLDQHAENLCTHVKNERTKVPSDRPIIFIAHSLGGIVTKDAMLRSEHSNSDATKAVSENTCGVAFMGTPHFGSADANLGYFFAYLLGMAHQSNVHPLAELKADGPQLHDLERRFSQLLVKRVTEKSPIEVACFCESLPPVGGVLGIATGGPKLVSKLRLRCNGTVLTLTTGRPTPIRRASRPRESTDATSRSLRHDQVRQPRRLRLQDGGRRNPGHDREVQGSHASSIRHP